MLVARRVTSRLGRTSGIGPTRIPFRRTVAALGRSQDEGSPVVADYDESVSPVQKRPLPDDETMAREWKPRAPVVTIMGGSIWACYDHS